MSWLLMVVVLIAYVGSNDINSDQNTACEKILEQQSKDSVFVNPVYFCTDNLGDNYYYSPIKTAVCDDTLCQIVLLKVYWDLAGHYSKFDTFPEIPLTKNDHKPFTLQDYEKLHETLTNENSVLGNKTEDELLDKSKSRYSKKIDGVTGATAREIKSEVVDGALYSTYTLWHVANGDIKQKLQKYTLSHYDSTIQQQLLKSQNPKSIIFALKNIDEDFYYAHFDQLINLMKRGNPLVNFYIAKNISEGVLDYGENKKSLLEIWNQLDPNTRSVLSKYLEQ